MQVLASKGFLDGWQAGCALFLDHPLPPHLPKTFANSERQVAADSCNGAAEAWFGSRHQSVELSKTSEVFGATSRREESI